MTKKKKQIINNINITKNQKPEILAEESGGGVEHESHAEGNRKNLIV
jgi:hypothetical protein